MNRPDCAVFLLLGFCIATLFLAVGGILTYNFTLMPHNSDEPDAAHQHIRHTHQLSPNEKSSQEMKMSNISQLSQGSNKGNGESQSSQVHSGVNRSQSESTLMDENSQGSGQNRTPGAIAQSQTSNKNKTADSSSASSLFLLQNISSNDSNNNNAGSSNSIILTFDEKEKVGSGSRSRNYVLAVIGPLFVLMGILLLLMVGILGMKYPCDYEPEPDIAFLRLRSELSLNFDSEKNNYELLRRIPTTSNQNRNVNEPSTSRTNVEF